MDSQESVQFLQRSVNGEELARLIISVLSVFLGLSRVGYSLLAVMRDGAGLIAAALPQLLLCTLPLCMSAVYHILLISSFTDTIRNAFFMSPHVGHKIEEGC